MRFLGGAGKELTATWLSWEHPATLPWLHIPVKQRAAHCTVLCYSNQLCSDLKLLFSPCLMLCPPKIHLKDRDLSQKSVMLAGAPDQSQAEDT